MVENCVQYATRTHPHSTLKTLQPVATEYLTSAGTQWTSDPRVRLPRHTLLDRTGPDQTRHSYPPDSRMHWSKTWLVHRSGLDRLAVLPERIVEDSRPPGAPIYTEARAVLAGGWLSVPGGQPWLWWSCSIWPWGSQHRALVSTSGLAVLQL